MSTSRATAWLPAYLALAVIWGFSFFFIKVGLESFTPAGVAFSRVALGAATLAVISVVLRIPLPPRWSWGYLAVTSVIWVSVPWLLFAFAETQVSSALAGIINGATPLMTLLVILLAFPEERPTPARVAGLAAGFLGILIVVGPGAVSGSPLGVLALVGAIACYGVAFPFARRYLTGPTAREPISPVAMAFGLMIGGLVITTPVALLQGATRSGLGEVSVGPAASLAALGVLGSGIAYVLSFRIVTRADATTASTVTYAITLVAVAAGAVLLGEPLGWNQAVGGALVLIGAALAQGLLRLPSRAGRSA